MKYFLLVGLLTMNAWASDDERPAPAEATTTTEERVTLETITISGDRKPASTARNDR